MYFFLSKRIFLLEQEWAFEPVLGQANNGPRHSECLLLISGYLAERKD